MPGKNKFCPTTGALPVRAPKLVGDAIMVPPPFVPTAGGPAKGVMLRNAAFMSILTFVAVAASGYPGTITVPLIVGVEPSLPQAPNVPSPGTADTKLHVGVGLARITSPSIWVIFG